MTNYGTYTLIVQRLTFPSHVLAALPKCLKIVMTDNASKENVFFFFPKLIDKTIEYKDGYALRIQVQQNHYCGEMYKQKYKICR